jgi:AcrR family transcriptional regulator
MARTGRRPGESGTKDAILAAARSSFAQRGYDATTIRSVAAAAGVDPALVHHYHGGKAELFAEAMRLPVNPAELVEALLDEGIEGFGPRLVRRILAVWDAQGDTGPLLGLVRSAATNERAAAMLREFLAEEVMGRALARMRSDRAHLRAGLAASQVMGLIMARYVVRVEPLTSADPDVLAAIIGETVQGYFTGPLPG